MRPHEPAGRADEVQTALLRLASPCRVAGLDAARARGVPEREEDREQRRLCRLRSCQRLHRRRETDEADRLGQTPPRPERGSPRGGWRAPRPPCRPSASPDPGGGTRRPSSRAGMSRTGLTGATESHTIAGDPSRKRDGSASRPAAAATHPEGRPDARGLTSRRLRPDASQPDAMHAAQLHEARVILEWDPAASHGGVRRRVA